MSEWISVDDRLPNKDEEVIIHTMTGEVMSAFFKEWTHVRTGKMMQAFQDYDCKLFTWWLWEVTHWQPLPEPPQ